MEAITVCGKTCAIGRGHKNLTFKRFPDGGAQYCFVSMPPIVAVKCSWIISTHTHRRFCHYFRLLHNLTIEMPSGFVLSPNSPSRPIVWPCPLQFSLCIHNVKIEALPASSAWTSSQSRPVLPFIRHFVNTLYYREVFAPYFRHFFFLPPKYSKYITQIDLTK